MSSTQHGCTALLGVVKTGVAVAADSSNSEHGGRALQWMFMTRSRPARLWRAKHAAVTRKHTSMYQAGGSVAA